jgi:hypothetical protein
MLVLSAPVDRLRDSRYDTEEARSLGRYEGLSRIRCASIRKWRTLRNGERDVLTEIEDYLGPVDINSDPFGTPGTVRFHARL